MADTRWIRVRGGMAGRNGYLVKIKGGYTGYFYADPEPVATFTLAAEGKHFFDNPENATSAGAGVTD